MWQPSYCETSVNSGWTESSECFSLDFREVFDGVSQNFLLGKLMKYELSKAEVFWKQNDLPGSKGCDQ